MYELTTQEMLDTLEELMKGNRTMAVTTKARQMQTDLKKRVGFFEVMALSKDDLTQMGYDVRETDDGTMEKVASKTGENLMESWESALGYTADLYEIPKYNFMSIVLTLDDYLFRIKEKIKKQDNNDDPAKYQELIEQVDYLKTWKDNDDFTMDTVIDEFHEFIKGVKYFAIMYEMDENQKQQMESASSFLKVVRA